MPETAHFSNSIQAQLEIYGSMFGMATLNLASPNISGHGSISNCHPGTYFGTLYYKEETQLRKAKQYRLECSVVDRVFSAAFFPRSSEQFSDQHALFVAEMPESDRFFHGVFEFS